MARIIFKRGKSSNLNSIKKEDGQLLFTTDEGRIYMDYLDGEELKRKLFYGGTLTIGEKTFNGTQDVNVDSYIGDYE